MGDVDCTLAVGGYTWACQDGMLSMLLALGKALLVTRKVRGVARTAQPGGRPEAVALLATRCPQHLVKPKRVTTVAPASERCPSDLFVTDG